MKKKSFLISSIHCPSLPHFPHLVHPRFPSGLSILPCCPCIHLSVHLSILSCCPSVHPICLSAPSIHQSSSHHPSFPHFSSPLFPHQIFVPVFLKPSPSLKERKKESYWQKFYDNLLREILEVNMQKGSMSPQM